ncbi:DUF5777 family beta-barrel protein [Aestuariivivens sediminis]|uniref:DUF5777 family beta-barrel protein n=1 Tax=Aestuariivivens sediminis TaxID=2913557 RepID=UPI001F578BAD|nr:DUF5777 family beta-barrel protein [Aestuariivivens sediminis]
MKNYKILLFVFLIIPVLCFSQKKAKDSIVEKPARPAFESATLIDNASNVLFNKNTLEVMMQHRFGLIEEKNSLAGIYGANSNIRIALSYAVLDWVTVGYGITKKNRMSDFNLKVGLLQQTRSGSIPVNISYFGNIAIDGRSFDTKYPNGDFIPPDANNGPFLKKQDRYSYFHQLIIAKRFNSKVSLQIAPSLSHFNAVNYGYDGEHDRFSIAFGGRYKVSPQTALIWDISTPVTQFNDDKYNITGFSFGAEFSTSAHTFQIFMTNFNSILPQFNYMKNTNDFLNGGTLFGFNITRNYNF